MYSKPHHINKLIYGSFIIHFCFFSSQLFKLTIQTYYMFLNLDLSLSLPLVVSPPQTHPKKNLSSNNSNEQYAIIKT